MKVISATLVLAGLAAATAGTARIPVKKMSSVSDKMRLGGYRKAHQVKVGGSVGHVTINE